MTSPAILSLAGCFVVALAVPRTAAAQVAAPAPPHDSVPVRVPMSDGAADWSRLHVRLAPGLRWTDAPEVDAAQFLRGLVGELPGHARVRPLFPTEPERLDAWFREAREAAERGGGPGPDHLGRWLQVDTDAPDELLAFLSGRPPVAQAYREPPVVLFGAPSSNDIPPATPDFTALQAPIVGPAPLGLDFEAVWPVSGGRGRGVTIFHLEADWFFGHEDLSRLQPSARLGAPVTGTREERDHGTSVIGILSADRNGYGLDGVADDAAIRVGSFVGLGGVGAAITAVSAAAQPGDVLALILGFDIQQTKPRDLVPFEYVDAFFMAIQTATLRGVHVVEAAGNGVNDLDAPRFGGRFDPATRDSGAVLVGATEGGQLSRNVESNFGRRVTVSAWGRDVPATGFGQLFLPNGDVQQIYTGGYAGTSAATSLVSGVVADLVGVMDHQLGRTASPAEIRALLERHGTRVLGGIGRRPDLARLLGALGLPDGLRLGALVTPRGGTAAGSLSGPAGGQAFLLAAFAPARVPVPGASRPLLLDPTTMNTLAVYALDGAGAATFQLPIPIDPGLAGLELELQAATLGPLGGSFALTSSANLRIE